MSMQLSQLTGFLAQRLREYGVDAVEAWDGQTRRELTAPAVAVSLRGCAADSGGFARYLGEQYNQETGRWEELYGRQAKLTIGLDVYAPRGQEQALQHTVEQMLQALDAQSGRELCLEEVAWEETGYDAGQRLLCRPVKAVCRARLYAAAQEGEEFVDFEIRGGISQ